MSLEEILEQYKVLVIWHKYVKVTAAVLLAVMVGFVAWGIFNAELRLLLIITGVVLGGCGAGLYLVVHRLYIKTGKAVLEYLRYSGMSEREIAEITVKYQITLPEFNTDKSGNG